MMRRRRRWRGVAGLRLRKERGRRKSLGCERTAICGRRCLVCVRHEGMQPTQGGMLADVL